MTEFSKCLNVVIDELLTIVRDRARASGKTEISCMMTELRPYVARVLDPTIPELTPDSRTKDWDVTVTFWDISTGRENADQLGECDPQVARGMEGVRKVIQQMVEEMYEQVSEAQDIPEFTDISLKRRLGGLRPSISRGRGRATLRVYYSLSHASRHMCTVLVARPEENTCAS